MDRRIVDGQENTGLKENTGWIGEYWMARRIVDGQENTGSKENTGWIGEYQIDQENIG